MNKEEKEKYYKLAVEIGEIIGKYGNNEQIELFQKILDDYKTKSSEYFKLQKENKELKEEQRNKLKQILKKNTLESMRCDDNYKEPLLHIRKEINELIREQNKNE